MLNKVLLIGNLGKDPEFRTTESGTNRASFTLATNEVYKDKSGNWQKSTEWHDVVMWRGLAERAKSLKKGMLVYVEGKLTHRKWQDRDGKDHYATDVTVDNLKILEKREGHHPSSGAQTNDNKDGTNPSSDFSANIDNDDLPF